ncbi:MAG: hypothetical protein IJ268_14270 [Proteobacteria bacterium]|nr:hypothetical protein [Pseudomonadota bacterium]
MFTPSPKHLAILCLLCAAGCNSQREAPKTEQSPAQAPQAAAQPDADGTAPKSDAPAAAECKTGSRSDDNCMCGKATVKLADVADWACGNGFWRCMNSKGCKNDGTPYPLGADMTEHGIQCGSRGDIPSLERFACDMDKSAWICIKKDCDCHGVEIQKGEMCLSSTCQGLTLENSDGMECSENGWKVLKAGAHTIGGKVYTLPEGIGIGRGIFTCSGHEINHPDHPVEYEMLWANVSQYACREIGASWNLGKHWICEADTCECGNDQCKKGEQCDNGKCVDLVRPCETGNCPCGNGTCMKDGICIDGHCVCGTPDGDMVRESSDPDEFPININDKYWVSDEGNIGRYSNLYVSNRYGEFTCDEYFAEGTCYSYTYFPRCENEKGCRTTDGRHFDHGSSLIHRQSYHIDAGFDTVRVTTEDGTCVLPRHDDLKRKRDAGDNPKEYICDEEICMCGQEKCFMGQICRLGNCEDDICHIPDDHKSKVFIKDDPDCYEDDDDEIEDDTREPKCEGKWILGYDSMKCIGGTRYCRGLEDTTSKPAPKAPEGYQCLDTDQNHKNAHKSWTCSAAEVCQCGGKPCPKGGICIDEKCIVKHDDQPSIDENSQLENSTIEDNKDTKFQNNKEEDNKDIKAEDNKQEDNKDIKAEDNKQEDNKDIKAEDNKQEDNTVGTPAINEPSVRCYDASPGKDYVCKLVMKSTGSSPQWICNLPEGCPCNGKTCPQNAKCDKEGIKCGEYLLHDSDPHQYACTNKGGEFYAQWIWECVDPNGCTCGNHLCRNFEICENNTCTCNGTIIPGPNYVCEYNIQYHPAWICKDPNSCECPGEYNKSSDSPCYPEMPANTVVRNDAYYCGDTPMPKEYREYLCNEEHQIICNAPSCICSDGKTNSVCPKHALCDKGKCLHPDTKQPITADKDGYYTDGLMHLCMNDKCSCDEATCKRGEYCMLGKCASPVVVYQNDQYFVGEYTSSDECPSHDELPESEYPEWKDDYLSYYFHIQESSRPVCSSWDFNYSETLICGLPSGCACGDIICPMGSACLGAQCDYNEDARDGQPIDKDNNISCKMTTIKAPRHDFKCDALGWTCQGTDCPCGDKDCKTGEICIASGTCASVIK